MNLFSAQDSGEKVVIHKVAGNYRSGKADLGKDFYCSLLEALH
ncbi:hypothetical protein [Coleofasciculus sp. FACHB-712]|nr:hypothetical protein [Coleofasciculus sp. FACHB-712]